MNVNKPQAPRDIKSVLRKQCGGYAVTARLPRGGRRSGDLTSGDRLTKSMAKKIPKSMCLHGETISVLALPVYDSMETPPDQEVYELRYRKGRGGV